MCTCGTHYISIATVNHCDGVGPNVTKVVDYPEPDEDEMCDVDSGRNKTESSMIIQWNLDYPDPFGHSFGAGTPDK